MLLDLSRFNLEGKVVAVALSGGSDSIALIHYMKSQQAKFHFVLRAVNVEHGIRGESSKKDSLFVSEFCSRLSLPLRSFIVDAPTYSKNNKLSLEEGARALRYQCFYEAIAEGFCDLIATAHHESDNFESLLFNLFRGTGTRGITGIDEITPKDIIRPLLHTSKEEINEYITKNNLPFVTDETNLDDKYTRNFLRLNVIPEIKKLFPTAEKSASRFCSIASLDEDYMDAEARKILSLFNERAEIPLPCHRAIFNRAIILSLKHLGIKKDWEKVHLDDCFALSSNENGKSINLLQGVVAVKEYDKLVLYKQQNYNEKEIPFALDKFDFFGKSVRITPVDKPKNLKNGFYADFDKISASAVIRTKREGDSFTKFGGGTKSLGDYLTDKKIPLRERASLPLLADGGEILAIFGVAISDKVKVDKETKQVVKLELLP